MTAYDMRISDWSSDVCSSDLQSVPDLWPRQPHAILSFWSTCLRSADDHAVCSADRPDFSVTSRYGRRGGWRGQRERENFRSPNAWNGDCGLRQYRDMVAGILVDARGRFEPPARWGAVSRLRVDPAARLVGRGVGAGRAGGGSCE